MPIYEYRCRGCGKRVAVFQRSLSVAVTAACDGCGSGDLSRLVSKFSTRRSGDDMFDGFDDAGGVGDFDESDPQSMARWARKMRDEMGEEGGPELDDMIDRLESGESVDSLMGGADDGGFGDMEDF
jgi:putative FmdB family regulatory protein